MQARAIHISGIVQGVGFRPFVYRLASQHDLMGWVRNTSGGVDLLVEGDPQQLVDFVAALPVRIPPLAHIDALTVSDCPPQGFQRFEIHESAPISGAMQPISPDVALCEDCRRELHDPDDRRYRYPFINCTNCGPRFTIISDLPYDRPATTMADFDLCPDCATEYHDPTNRRFHAQPVACPDCGPQVWLEVGAERVEGDDAIWQTAALLKAGAIIAIKGLGGFHLACDATDAAVIERLRRRKFRPAKALALMMADLDQVRAYCQISPAEAVLLCSPAAPIVLLMRRADAQLPDNIAPEQPTVGVMLPYTPLHQLLFDEGLPPLVMTSGNLSGEPVVTDNQAAREQLAGLADAWLMHNRDIHIRADDSVVRVWRGAELPLRRSRGMVPLPIRLPFSAPPLLATGGQLKNTFCVVRDDQAFMSHHIGDMEGLGALEAFEQGVAHFEHLFLVRPQVIVHDLHPDYATTGYAQQRAAAEGLALMGVQHHHAHIAACLLDNAHPLDEPVIGVCFDGTGYGDDGTIWGGEFMIADYADYERVAHLKPLPLPGGDAAIREPARVACAYLLASGLALAPDLAPVAHLSDEARRVISQQIERNINTPLTSSAGRLFDAVAALLGICQTVSYEGQAAIELEAVADPDAVGLYPLPVSEREIALGPLLAAVVADLHAGEPIATIAGRFHNSIAALIVSVCQRLARTNKLDRVALSGGVFQNTLLLDKTVPSLEAAGLHVYTHRRVPPNDGGLALGQAAIAAVRYSEKAKTHEISG